MVSKDPQGNSSESMDISVNICTWNRAEILRRTLGSFERLTIPDDVLWELIVVDNNCTDHTADVIKSFQDRLPIRHVFEPQQGHSASRNAAVKAGQGNLILWTDDDVQVDKDWLRLYWEQSVRQPEVTFWGGSVRPDFEQEPPKWVTENWEACAKIFAIREWTESPEPMGVKNSVHLPFGANFAIRGDVQRQFLFDTEFGRKGEGMRGFDEIDLFKRLLELDHRGDWCIEAAVDHFIPADRVSLDYVERYYQGQGETWVVRGVSDRTAEDLRGQLRKLRRKYSLSRRISSSKNWFPQLVTLGRLQGQLLALERLEEA